MGFFYRKRVNFGPFALNFSTKGVGVSTGVTGVRLSTGPNGTFVHLGRHGFYYRKKIGGFSEHTKSQDSFDISSESEDDVDRIESADIKKFQKSSSDKLLKEINEKNALVRYSSVSLIISIVVFVSALMTHAPAWLNIVIITLSIVSYSFFFKKDVERKTVTVIYKLEDDIKPAFAKVNKGFQDFEKVDSLWRVETQQSTNDWKRNSGASNLVNRKSFEVLKELPSFFDSNITPYGFSIDNKQYYFFPDRILVYQGKDVGMTHYSELKIDTSITRFIEDDSVPKDAEIVGHNWRYINKDGGPDRRFNNNYQIPVVLYSEIDLKSRSGINLKFQASDKHAGEKFASAFEEIKKIT